MNSITDDHVVLAMLTYGGSFVSGLGNLWRMGDADNRARIKAAFPEYWAQYTELALMKQQRDEKRKDVVRE